MKNNYIKTLILVLVLLSISFSINAQYFPYGINYQAVARNSEGYPISNREIVLEISILRETGNEIVWQETHIGTTDKFGLLNVVIGQGATTLVGSASNFESIDWNNDKYFAKVRADFGDEDYVNGMVDLGTTPLQSVPYALTAARALEAPLPNLSDVVNANEANLNIMDGIAWDGTAWTAGSFFLAKDGTTDLSGDWTISNNSISLTNGTLLANNLKTNQGETINNFSSLISLGNSDNTVSTQKAVKTYVDNRETSIKDYVDDKFALTWLISTDNKSLYNMTKKIGIGVMDPLGKVHADLNRLPFLLEGEFNPTEDFTTITDKSSLTFIPSLAAFRAGFDELGFWAKDNVGSYSVAFGRNNQASGDGSFASGYNNIADGSQSFIAGAYNEVPGPTSAVFGQHNIVEGRSSLVMGEYLIAESYLETVFGTFNRKKTGIFGVDGNNYQADDLLFVVGYGTSDSDRKNALTIVKNGNVGINTTKDPTSTLEVEGSVASTVLKTSASLTLSKAHNIVLVQATAGNVTITLPDPTLCIGREYTIKKIDIGSNTVTIDGNGSTIDGFPSIILFNQWEYVKIINDGSLWYVIGNY